MIMYCQFCGAELEDGRQCTCRAAQQAAAQQQAEAQPAAPQPAVPKTVLTQEQKEEMQKMMAQAGESAKTAGKALWSSAKVAGTALGSSARAAGKVLGTSAKSLAGSAQGALSNGEAMKSPALYRKVMMAFGALHILFFLFLSYAGMDRMGADWKFFTQLTGIEIPRRLTGLNMIRLTGISARVSKAGSGEAALAVLLAVVLFALPVLCGVLLIVLNRRRKEGGMTSSVVLSVLTLLSYLLMNAFMTSGDMTRAFREMGYKMGFGFGFAVIVVILQIAAAVTGHIVCRKAREAAATAAEK